MHEAGEILRVENADDVLWTERGVIDGHAGVLLVDDACGGALDGHVRWEGEDAATRRHDLAHGDVAEFDGAMDDLLLENRKQAATACGRGDELDLLRGMDVAFAGERNAEEAQNKGSGGLHKLDCGTGDADEDVHRSGDGQGNAFAALHGQTFRDLFAEEDFEVRDAGEGYDRGDAMRVEIDMTRDERDCVHPRDTCEDLEDDVRESRFAYPAEGKRGERDAKLVGGEKLVHIAFETER